MAERTSFNLLPVEGAKFPRDISRVVNQAMNGKTNNVTDITITGEEIEDANFRLRVNDIRVSEQSYINFVAKSVNAIIQPVAIIEQGKGFFIAAFGDPNAPLGYGQGQASDAVPFNEAVQANVFAQVTTTNFVFQGTQINTTHANGVLTVLRAGTYSIFTACSLGGTPLGNNNTITFGGIKNNDPALAEGANWTRRGNATGIPISFGAYVDLAEGDTFAAAVRVDANDTVEFDNVIVSIFTVGTTLPLPLLDSDTFDYRYVVIG